MVHKKTASSKATFPDSASYYEILNVPMDADFVTIKKAYYRMAKQCHPDLYGGSPEKEEIFKKVVEAFSVLSSTRERMLYDMQLAARQTPNSYSRQAQWEAFQETSIMDSEADDILEELIVGNDIPTDTHISRIFTDMQKTHKFIRFREALSHFEQARYSVAEGLLRQCVRDCPINILYQYYLGRTLEHLGRMREAAHCYRTCLRIGKHRIEA
ncbi:MAG: J domain-containing protein, partial [Lentisphaerae bacterium]